MNCPNCHAENDNDNIFCVSCGGNLVPPKPGASTAPSPTEYYNPNQINPRNDAPESVQTAFRPAPNFNQPTANFNPSIPYTAAPQQRKGYGKFILLGAFILLLLIGGGIGAFFIINKQTTPAEVLPDHLGLFIQNSEKKLTEIGKQDYANAVQAKDDLMKNESLPLAEDKANVLLYSDAKDVPVSDLKLVQLDTLKDDGTVKQINFQASPVEGKPEIKRLRVPDGLANGKYAFALFDGFLDEGKHKFWAFQVKSAQKNDNGDLAKAVTLSVKPKQNTPASNTNSNATNAAVKIPPTPKPAPVAPPGARVAYCESSDVVVRSAPSLTAKKISELRRGQKVYVINYSDNYDEWNGMEGNWAYIQTESGGRGWVFSPFIGY